MTSQKDPQGEFSTLTKVTGPCSWSRVSCPCCISSHIEPLVLIQLAENVQPITKQWIMSMISAPVKAGGEEKTFSYSHAQKTCCNAPVVSFTSQNYMIGELIFGKF